MCGETLGKLDHKQVIHVHVNALDDQLLLPFDAALKDRPREMLSSCFLCPLA